MTAPRRTASSSRLRTVVLGYIVRGPVGGMAWHYLHYALGLARLGHEVLFVEDSADYPSCYNPTRDAVEADPAFGLTFARDAFQRVGLADRWAYYCAHRQRWCGPGADIVLSFARSADLLLNVSGVNPVREWMLDIPARAFIDTDPAFTQIRHLKDAGARERAAAHTAFFSFGERIGQSGCSIPPDGFDWRATRQPLVLGQWPVTTAPVGAPFSTVMQWDSYDALEHDGVVYGMKSRSFAPYMDLPSRTSATFSLAVGSPSAPREALRAAGWRVENPLEVTRSPWRYREFIQTSAGEFSVAKQGYVLTRSGWFSERSACYLASGRPVILEDTGYSRVLPTGEGLFGYASPDSALAAIEACLTEPDRNAKAAREVAAEYFASDHVLSALVEQAMNWEPPQRKQYATE